MDAVTRAKMFKNWSEDHSSNNADTPLKSGHRARVKTGPSTCERAQSVTTWNDFEHGSDAEMNLT